MKTKNIKRSTTKKKIMIAKKITTKKLIAKKPIISKKSTIKSKKSTQRKKSRNFKFFGYTAIASGIVAVIAIILYFFPGIIPSIASNNSAVLSTNVSSIINNYSVNEDDLLMFSTLAYESPSKVVPDSGTFFGKSKTFLTHDTTQMITRCGKYSTEADMQNRKACMTASESPANHYMYTTTDIIGTDYEAKILKDAKNRTTADIVGHLGQYAFTAFIGKEVGESFYFSDLANLGSSNSAAGNLAGWDAVDFYEAPAFDSTNNYGLISAVTFKRGNDIVIAYRGTDLTDVFDWFGVDGSYGLKNNSQQDNYAKEYALSVAKLYNSDGNKNYNIYTTGHSLGGYLAQVAGSGLLALNDDNTISNPYNLQRIVYFNGMGLFFSNKSTTNPANEQIAARDRLKAFNITNTGKVNDKILLVHMYGDAVSSIGVHYGQVRTLHVANSVVEKHNNFYKLATGTFFDNISSLLGTTSQWNTLRNSTYWRDIATSSRNYVLNNLNKVLGKWTSLSLSQIPGAFDYQLANNNVPFNGILPYFMSTHETDSFFYTGYYDQILKSSGVAGSVVTPPISSISNASSTIEQTLYYGNYGILCDFKPNYDSSYYYDASQPYYGIYLKSNGELSARVTCTSPTGFNDTEISSGDFAATDNNALYPSLIGIKIDNPKGSRLQANNPNIYYWDVKILPVKRFLSSNIRIGLTKSLYLKTGSVIAKPADLSSGAASNEPSVFPYVIETTNSNVPDPVYIGPSVAINTSATTQTNANATIPCTVEIPVGFTNLAVQILPWQYKFGNGTITCTSNQLLKDFVIQSKDLQSYPSSRIKFGLVQLPIRTILGNKYVYKYSFRFRGSYFDYGNATIGLKSGAISQQTSGTTKTTNASAMSNSIKTHR